MSYHEVFFDRDIIEFSGNLLNLLNILNLCK